MGINSKELQNRSTQQGAGEGTCWGEEGGKSEEARDWRGTKQEVGRTEGEEEAPYIWEDQQEIEREKHQFRPVCRLSDCPDKSKLLDLRHED